MGLLAMILATCSYSIMINCTHRSPALAGSPILVRLILATILQLVSLDALG